MMRKNVLLQMDGNITEFCYNAELETKQRETRKKGGDIKQWAIAKVLKTVQGLPESNIGLDIWGGIGGPYWKRSPVCRVRRGGELNEPPAWSQELPRVTCLQKPNERTLYPWIQEACLRARPSQGWENSDPWVIGVNEWICYKVSSCPWIQNCSHIHYWGAGAKLLPGA